MRGELWGLQGSQVCFEHEYFNCFNLRLNKSQFKFINTYFDT